MHFPHILYLHILDLYNIHVLNWDNVSAFHLHLGQETDTHNKILNAKAAFSTL